MSRVRVKIWEDRMGNVLGQPVRDDIRMKIKEHLRGFGIHSDGGRFFFQEGGDAEQFKEEFSARQRHDLQSGWTVYINIDPWELGHWYGWDTHTIFE